MTARRENLAGWLWVSPWAVGFVAFMLVPAAISLYHSFTDYPLLEPPLWAGWSNYARLLGDGVFLRAAGRTALYAGVSIPLTVVLTLAIAALLNARVRGAGLFQAAVFVPTLVPLAASAMIWLWLFNAEHGPVNRVLGRLGVRGPNWLTDSDWALPSLVLIGLWSIGQMVLVCLAALRDVPAELHEAAAIDGMGPLRRFLRVTLPMISPVVLFNVVTLTIATLQLFTIPFVLVKATPGGDPRSMYFYTSYLYDSAFVYGQMGYASAMAWVQLLLTLALTGLLFAAGRRVVYYRG